MVIISNRYFVPFIYFIYTQAHIELIIGSVSIFRLTGKQFFLNMELKPFYRLIKSDHLTTTALRKAINPFLHSGHCTVRMAEISILK